jgi:hypothetical protein
MKIEAGKRYVRRDGKISGVMAENKSSTTHKFEEVSGLRYAYMKSGHLYSSKSEEPQDLIREYTEPTAEGNYPERTPATAEQRIKAMERLTNRGMIDFPDPDDKAEPQDEWGPWIYLSNEDCEVPDIFEGIEVVYRDGKVRKWRLKNNPPLSKVVFSQRQFSEMTDEELEEIERDAMCAQGNPKTYRQVNACMNLASVQNQLQKRRATTTT